MNFINIILPETEDFKTSKEVFEELFENRINVFDYSEKESCICFDVASNDNEIVDDIKSIFNDNVTIQDFSAFDHTDNIEPSLIYSHVI